MASYVELQTRLSWPSSRAPSTSFCSAALAVSLLSARGCAAGAAGGWLVVGWHAATATVAATSTPAHLLLVPMVSSWQPASRFSNAPCGGERVTTGKPSLAHHPCRRIALTDTARAGPPRRARMMG